MLGAPQARSSSARKLPTEKKPRVYVLAGLTVLAVSYCILWLGFPFILVEAMSRLLSAAQVTVTKTLGSEVPSLVVMLIDGSYLNLPLTWQRCGLVSVTVFGLLFLFLMYPFRGSFWLKVAWLELGFLIGLCWSLIRLSLATLISYYLGAGAFAVVEFLTGPFTDIFWVVAVWSLMLSTLTSRKNG